MLLRRNVDCVCKNCVVLEVVLHVNHLYADLPSLADHEINTNLLRTAHFHTTSLSLYTVGKLLLPGIND
jgi:hypothetical protein